MKYEISGSESFTPDSVSLFSDLPPITKPSVWARLKMAIADFLYTLPMGDEYKIWQHRDRNGTILWCFYCPHTRTVRHFLKEEDVLLAIEKPGQF